MEEVRLTLALPVALSVKLLQLKLSVKAGVFKAYTQRAFTPSCFVNVIGPVPAALLIVVARISDNAQVPP